MRVRRLRITRSCSSAITGAEHLFPSNTVTTITPITSPNLVPSRGTKTTGAEWCGPSPESGASRVVVALAVGFVAGRATMPVSAIVCPCLVVTRGAWAIAERRSPVPVGGARKNSPYQRSDCTLTRTLTDQGENEQDQILSHMSGMHFVWLLVGLIAVVETTYRDGALGLCLASNKIVRYRNAAPTTLILTLLSRTINRQQINSYITEEISN